MINLYDILKENLIIESQESKSQAKAKKLAITHGMNSEEAEEFVRVNLRSMITNLRHSNTAKFTLGCTRLFFDKELTSAKDMSMLNDIIELIANKYIDKFDQNLNGLSLNELNSQFNGELESIEQQNREDVNSKTYENNGYKIVPINSFEEAQEYYKYLYKSSPWCITYMGNMWDNYTQNGINQVYFCLKDGFENIKPNPTGDPMDEYGLSMISIIVDEDGKLAYSTTRWNHANGANGDHDFTAKEISEVVGVNFYETFKPYDGDDYSERRGKLDYEDYHEQVMENRRYINSFGGYEFFFSQDLDPYEDNYTIANDNEYMFGVIANDDWGEDIEVTDYSYNMNNSIAENKEGFYFILTDDTNQNFELVYSQGEYEAAGYDNTYINSNYDTSQENTLVAVDYSDKLFILNKEEGVVYESENSITSFKRLFQELGNYIQIVEGYNNFSLINADDGKVIVESELPLNNEEFTLDDENNIQCKNGTYDFNGNIISGTGRFYTIKNKISDNLFYVVDRNEKYNIYNEENNTLLFKTWYQKINVINKQNFTATVELNDECNVVKNINGKLIQLFKENYYDIEPLIIEHNIFYILTNIVDSNDSKKSNIADKNGNLLFNNWKMKFLSVNGKQSREWAYVDDDYNYVIFDILTNKITTPPMKFRQISTSNFPDNEVMLGVLKNKQVAILYRNNQYQFNENLIFNNVEPFVRNDKLLIITDNNNKKNLFNIDNNNLMLKQSYDNVQFIGYDYNQDVELGITLCQNGTNYDVYGYNIEDNYNFIELLTNINDVISNMKFGYAIRDKEYYITFKLHGKSFALTKNLMVIPLDNNDNILDNSKYIPLLNFYNYTTESIQKQFFKKYNLIENIIKDNFIR